MLIIRHEQLRVLESVVRQRFEERVASHLLEVYEDDVVDGAGLRALITTGVDKAREHGFESEIDVVAFIEKMVELGPDFDAHPWASQALAASSLEPAAKMDLIERYRFVFDREAE